MRRCGNTKDCRKSIRQSLESVDNELKILLKEIRLSQGITLRDLAEHSGITKSTLNNIELGRHSPTMDEMEILARSLDVSIGELFESEYK